MFSNFYRENTHKTKTIFFFFFAPREMNKRRNRCPLKEFQLPDPDNDDSYKS